MYFRDVFTISKLKTSLKFYFFNIYDLYFKFRLSRKIIKQLKYNDYLVLLSKYFKNDLVKLIGEKNKSKILSISNPLSFNVRPESIKLNEKENQILYVGRFDSLQKRPDRLLEAWKLIQSHISDWQLILIGDGEQKIYLKKFIESNNLKNVTLKGFTDPTKYYYKSKILCLTSSYEGFGMVLTEAQQYGVVPIAFESYESIHDIIINERNGILIKPFSIKDYAKTLLHLMNDSSYRNYLAENALKDSQKFSLDEIGSQWLKLFQKK